MRIVDGFTVAAPADRVWGELTDLAVVASCLPGAELDRVGDDGVHRGRITVRVGSVAAAFAGEAGLEDVDRVAGTVVLVARGTSKLGGVTLRIDGSLAAVDAGTHVELVTDVQLTGRLAQFGHTVGERITRRMIEDLVAGLRDRLEGGGEDAVPAEAPATEAAWPRRSDVAVAVLAALVGAAIGWVSLGARRRGRAPSRSASTG